MELNKKNINGWVEVECDSEFSEAEHLLYALGCKLEYDTLNHYCDESLSLHKNTWTDNTLHFTLKRNLLDKQSISDVDFSDLLREFKIITNRMVVDYVLKEIEPEKITLTKKELAEFKQKHSPHEITVLTNDDYKQIPKQTKIFLCKRYIMIQFMAANYTINKGVLKFDINIIVEQNLLKQHNAVKYFYLNS